MSSVEFALGRLVLLAQEAGGAPNDPLRSLWGYMPIFMILLLLFFMIIRPQQRERQRHEELLKQLKKNDRVLTNAGIFGVVVSVSPEKNEVVLRVDEKTETKLQMQLSSVARVLTDEQAAPTKTENS